MSLTLQKGLSKGSKGKGRIELGMESAGIVELNASDPFKRDFRRGQVGLNCGAWGIECWSISGGLNGEV